MFPDCCDQNWTFSDRREKKKLVVPDFADRGKMSAIGVTEQKLAQPKNCSVDCFNCVERFRKKILKAFDAVKTID